jgi:hypothetical protein
MNSSSHCFEIVSRFRHINCAKEQSQNKFRLSQPAASVLKLRCSRLWEFNGLETQGIIITRRVSEGFTETLVERSSSIPHLRFGLEFQYLETSRSYSGTVPKRRIARCGSWDFLSWLRVDLHFTAESLQACDDDLIGHRDASPDDSTLPHQRAQFDGSSLSN